MLRFLRTKRNRMASLYANENFPRPVVIELRGFGHDVLTTEEAGNSDQEIPDDEVLEFAKDQERAIVTLNRKDFIRLHRQDSDHAGIIVCTVDADFFGQATRIHEAIDGVDLEGQLIRVNRPG